MNPAPDALFRAFADPTRLRLLRLLSRGELCVCDLLSVVELPQPTVSRHLAYLRRSGLVIDRKQGPWRYYRLAPARSLVHRRLLTCVDGCLDGLPALRRDAAALARLRASSCR